MNPSPEPAKPAPKRPAYVGGATPQRHKSTVSNGTRLFTLQATNGRSATARRFKDLVMELTDDLGGKENLSAAKKQLVRRAAGLACMSEAIEGDLVSDRPFDVGNYHSGANNLRRIFESLGLVKQSGGSGQSSDRPTVFRIIGGLPLKPQPEAIEAMPIGEGPASPSDQPAAMGTAA